ncbi:MAG: type II secretion system protein [Planctomycetota bacterium]|jgi:prepilin-type N-terminal cleavage/methylation domain-containing protein/prepilin-type processing-associated H-X9-DG protein
MKAKIKILWSRRDCARWGTKGWEAGFTLVELLVVIGIIALLLSIFLPSLGKARSSAMRLRCVNNLKQLDIAMALYLNGNEDTYPCREDPVSTEPFYWLWMGRGWRSFIEPYLDTKTDEKNPSVLWCIEDKVSKEKYESTSYAYSMSFYHSVEQIDSMSSSADTYSNVQPSIPQHSYRVAQPSGTILIGEWLRNHNRIESDIGWWTREGQRNYLFADGHVRYLKSKEIREGRDGLPDANLTIHGIEGIDWPR